MISSKSPVHNLGKYLILPFAFFLLLGSGCSGNKEADESASKTPVTSKCSTIIETGAWDMLVDFGTRATAGEDISLVELQEFGAEPSMALWLQTTEGTPLPAKRLGYWLELTFWDELGRTGPKKNSPNERLMSRFNKYNFKNSEKISQYINDFRENDEGCALLELAEKWIAPENLSLPITIHFVPGKPELRILRNHFFLDTGMAAASPTGQLQRQCVGLLYRSAQTIAGDNPIEVKGAHSISQSLRVFCNEGIASWIGDMPNVYFASDHPSLGKIEIVPEELFHSGRKAIGMLDRQIPRFMASEEDLLANGHLFAREFAASMLFTKAGYTMAATIAGNLGEERLLQVRTSVSGFISSYQEAALLNPVPTPVPGQPGVELFTTMPPFSPEVFQWLMETLKKDGL